MNTLTYYLPNDIYAYTITCNYDMLDGFVLQLIEEGAYKIILDNEGIHNEVIYNG